MAVEVAAHQAARGEGHGSAEGDRRDGDRRCCAKPGVSSCEPDDAPPLPSPTADAPPLAPPPAAEEPPALPMQNEGATPPILGDAAPLPEPPTEDNLT